VLDCFDLRARNDNLPDDSSDACGRFIAHSPFLNSFVAPDCFALAVYVYYIKMKRYGGRLGAAVFTVFALFTGSCAEIFDFIEQPANKTAVITDIDRTQPPLISDMNGKMIFLALLREGQTIDELSFLLMRDYIRGAGEVANNRICLKLYAGRADYWTDSGSY
jgi:hypothetical protein